MNNNNYNEEYLDEIDNIEMETIEERVENLENSINNKDYSGLILVYMPGLVLAMILSYEANHSILWSILHGYLSWIYVIYNTLF